MKKNILYNKFLSILIITVLLSHFGFPYNSNAVDTNWNNTPWTLEKAEYLAKKALIWATPKNILELYNAWSSQNAVNILFPSKEWPDRTNYLAELDAFKWLTFNPNDTTSMRKLYAFKYYRDPYEAKIKLFWFFEDVFSVDKTWDKVDQINFPDVENHFNTLYNESLWNYKTMIKKVLFDANNPENSYAMWTYLNLLNGINSNFPNENYSREMMQLFMMSEYKPREWADNSWAIRNYSEEDVASLAKIITWFRNQEDKKVFFDVNFHNTSTWILFLTWSLKQWDNFPFYNSSSWTIDNNLIINSINWNNWLWDNIVDYIFSKRENEISYFLSSELLRYYTWIIPNQSDVIQFSNQIRINNFEILPSVKWLLASNLMYSSKVMNAVIYKTPIEMTIWTLKLLHYKNPSIIDPLINDWSLLTNFDWVPYNPRSVFWRTWFDDNQDFMNSYFHNQWVTFSSKIAYSSWSWYYDLSDLFPSTKLTNSWIVNLKTNSWNTFSWRIDLTNIEISLNENVFQNDVLIQWNISENSIEVPEFIIENSNTWSVQETSEVNLLTWSVMEIPESIVDRIQTWSTQEMPEPQIETMQSWSTQEMPKIKTENTNTWKIQEIDEMVWFWKILNNLSSIIIPKANAIVVNQNTISFETWTIVFPDFYILTNSWNIINLEWNFNWNNWVLTISSWTLSYWTWNYSITNSDFSINSWYSFERDITIDEMISQLEDYLYLWKKLPESVKNDIKNYLLKDVDWLDRLFLPNSIDYRNKYIKAVVSMMLSQVEFILQSWYDVSQITENSWATPLNDASKKLIMIELYWWYDWMNWIIPKSDFNYYQSIRWNIALAQSDLIDLWSVYLNKNIGVLKPFFDNWELRIVNRVWAPNHSRGHDTATIQVASELSSQKKWTPGLIWELIKNESNILNNISLWTSKPAIYTNWQYVNIWSNSILYKNNIWGTSMQEKTMQTNTLKSILNTRAYPWNTKKIFISSSILDNVWNSWQAAIWNTLSWKLNFTKNLIDSWIWITYYIPGGWWYDTHADELRTWTWTSYDLNDRTSDLFWDITNYFSDLKASWKDITIIVYSEFWRTLKTNWTNWTDHWKGWWYFILTTNNALKNSIPDKIVWKLIPEKEKEDWLWVWIDYRSIYSKILSSLYNIDVVNYFKWEFKLEDDINNIIPNPALLRTELNNKYPNNINVDFKFKIEDKNFRVKEWSYINFFYWEDSNNLNQLAKSNINNWTLDDWNFKLNVNLDKLKKYYYKLEITDNQYDKYLASWSFISPNKFLTNSSNIVIPLWTDSIFEKYNNTQVLWNTNINKLILFDNPEEIISNSGSITSSWNSKNVFFTWWISLIFWTWETSISTLTNSWIWNWWFIIPHFIKKEEFFSEKSIFNWEKLKNLNVESLMKVWADTLWIWMKLNQNVWIELPVKEQNWQYKIISSEDWINWIEINNSFLTWSFLKFQTDHFSYFALVKQWVLDSVPDTFSFNNLVNTELNSQIVSNEIIVSGINSAISLSINSGEYSINSGAWNSSNTIINNGDKIKLRLTSSSSYSTQSNIVINLWSVSNSWLIITKQAPNSLWWSSWWSSWWWGGWWWTVISTKDKCPDWDFSKSYYDKTCWVKTSSISIMSSNITSDLKNVTKSGANSKIKLEDFFDKKSTNNTFKDLNWVKYLSQKLINWKYILKEVDWNYINKIFSKQIEIIIYLRFKLKSSFSDMNKKVVSKEKVLNVYISKKNKKYEAIRSSDWKIRLRWEDWTYEERVFTKYFEIIKYLSLK